VLRTLRLNIRQLFDDPARPSGTSANNPTELTHSAAQIAPKAGSCFSLRPASNDHGRIDPLAQGFAILRPFLIEWLKPWVSTRFVGRLARERTGREQGCSGTTAVLVGTLQKRSAG